LHSIDAIRTALLDFFDSGARDLPWRRADADPYAVWISEVMSQQTRIETVVPYYERWMRRFPDVRTLAEAPLDDVLKTWEGLGYYTRARNLHAAAALVREQFAGQLPGSAEQLRKLPGIGDYTAGAVASIAFGEDVPAVDGNVRRVLTRLYDEAAPSSVWLRRTAAALVPPDRPGDFNQALMELGATICTPRSPRCSRCPVSAHCAARAAGTQLHRPRPRPTRAVPVFDIATAILRRADGRVLIERRPDSGLLAGLWQLPGVELTNAPAAREVAGSAATASGDAAAAAERAAVAAVLELAGSYGSVEVGSAHRHLCTVEHTFSHRRERYVCMLIEILPHHARAATGTRWIGSAGHSKFALPRAQQRILTTIFS
jgi:A/G-specific adenine glycosylase